MLSDAKNNMGRCLKCGACRLDWVTKAPICPSGIRSGLDSHYAIGRVSLARAILDGSFQIEAEAAATVMTCADCRSCDVQCAQGLAAEPSSIIKELKRAYVEAGALPSTVEKYLKTMGKKRPNSYDRPWRERGHWAEESAVERFSGQEYLLFVGEAGAFDALGKRNSAAVAQLLKKAGVSFGALLEDEPSDGSEVLALGDDGLFEMLAEVAIDALKTRGVKKIITICPHSLDSFKHWNKLVTGHGTGLEARDEAGQETGNEARLEAGHDARNEAGHEAEHEVGNEAVNEAGHDSGFGGKPRAEFEFTHYTSFLAALMSQEKFKPSKPFPNRVTFHDPCHLGRHHGEYEAPRSLLKSIPGLELAEMERNRDRALCCGGGGGNAFTGMLGSGPLSPARARINEAKELGASVLATACPLCRVMLAEEAKAMGEDRIKIMDLAEILTAATL